METPETIKTRHTRTIVEKYLAHRLAARLATKRRTIARAGRLFVMAWSAGLACRLGVQAWYYLEYDIDFLRPQASKYLKDRFR